MVFRARILAIAHIIAAIFLFIPSVANALSESDILGKWCTAAGYTEFTRDQMKVFRKSDSKTFTFRIARYEHDESVVTVYWINGGQEKNTQYGRFGRDGRTMVQLSSSDGPERPHRRC